MKIKTSELTGAALDWAVAKAEGLIDADIKVGKATTKAVVLDGPHGPVDMRSGEYFRPSTDWSQGGPISDRERISTEWSPLWGCWAARDLRNAAFSFMGPTALVAAMRCYVASKLGDEVEVPEELL